jgi:hypothetical protein
MTSHPIPNSFLSSEQGAATGKRQPWFDKAIWPHDQRSNSKPGFVNYAYSAGTRMIVPGSAGEWNWTIVYDTEDKVEKP